MGIGKQITETAIKNGANLAGIANVKALKASASHSIYTQLENYSGVGTLKGEDTLAADQLFNWPPAARSILVVGLAHPRSLPKLDWWDGRWGTPGNRLLIDIMQHTRQQIETHLKITTHKLHYYVQKGGVFLKDAAVLAGLGCIGKNNMLVTRDYGPRVRLRALFLDAEIQPTGPVRFDPCAGCKELCRRACPQKAFGQPVYAAEDYGLDTLPGRDGHFSRSVCNVQMQVDNDVAQEKTVAGVEEPVKIIKYCRKCEWACPVGEI